MARRSHQDDLAVRRAAKARAESDACKLLLDVVTWAALRATKQEQRARQLEQMREDSR